MPEKNDNTTAEQIVMYLLLTLNLFFGGIAIRNIVTITRKKEKVEHKKLLFLNCLMLLVIISKLSPAMIGNCNIDIKARISYEMDAIPRTLDQEGLSKQVYVFLGVLSVILFNILMMLCAYFW